MDIEIVKQYKKVCVIVAMTNLIIWCSKYDIQIKILLTILSVLIFLTLCLKPIRCKLMLLAAVVVMIVINIFYMHQVYYPYLLTLSGAYNSSVGWLTTQTGFTWNTGNSDAVLPAILEGKHVYIAEEDSYFQYVMYFSESIELIENTPDCKYKNWQDEFLRIGGMGAAALDWLFHESTIADMQEKDFRPVLYISSSSVADEKDLFISSDDDFNLFIMSLEEYEKMK